jgi:hypothetical protein
MTKTLLFRPLDKSVARPLAKLSGLVNWLWRSGSGGGGASSALVVRGFVRKTRKRPRSNFAVSTTAWRAKWAEK